MILQIYKRAAHLLSLFTTEGMEDEDQNDVTLSSDEFQDESNLVYM